MQAFNGGVWQNDTIYADGRLLATCRGSVLTYSMTDWLGTKRAQIGSDGNTASYAAFGSYPFGNGYSETGSSPDANDLHFTGKESDFDTGNDYFGARFYNPNMGRFLGPDWALVPMPIPYGKLGNPQSLNLYVYLQNNPLSSMDEDGHGGCDDSPELCKAILDSVTSGGSIVEGWANRLSQIGNQISSGVATAKKDLDTFNSVLGFGKTNCAGGGSCSGAFGQAVGAVVAAVASDGESEAGVVEKQLTFASEKIDRIIAGVTEEDLGAAEREANGGMRVAKPGGGEYSHVVELNQYANGLNKQAIHLEKMLKRSDLSDSQIDRINSTIEKARGMVTTIQKATGGSN